MDPLEAKMSKSKPDSMISIHDSPDESRLLTASNDGTAQVWDLDSARLLAILKGHWLGVTDVAMTPSGDLAVTTSLDGTGLIWDMTLEQRDPAVVHQLIETLSPWQLNQGRLIPRQRETP